MEKLIKNPGKSNIKLSSKNINNTKELIAAAAETVKKAEADIKLMENQSDMILKKTLLLDGLG